MSDTEVSINRPASVEVGKEVLPDVGNDAAEGTHDHRQFLSRQPRLSGATVVVITAQRVHAGHPALVILTADQHHRVAVLHRPCKDQ